MKKKYLLHIKLPLYEAYLVLVLYTNIIIALKFYYYHLLLFIDQNEIFYFHWLSCFKFSSIR